MVAATAPVSVVAHAKVLLRLRRTLEKLAAMIPKPHINLLVYHGVFAPHARDRPGAVRRAQAGARRRGTLPGARWW